MLKFKKKIQMGYIILQNNSVIWLHKQNHDTPGSQAAAVSVIEEKKKHLNLSENAFYEVSRG